MFIGRSFFDIRPAGFSNLLVAVFLFILVLTTYRNILYIWLIVPLTVFWCNVHGGYIYAFIMLIPFIGLHLLTNCTKKWTAILYNVTAWPFFYFVVSKAGLTLATFLFLILLAVLDITLVFYKQNLVSIKWKGLYHTIAAGVVAFLAMVLFNPFHLTNLTHTFVISVSEHAARWRDIHEWHPAFDWDNPVGTAIPFLAMYIIVWVILAVWAVVLLSASRSISRYSKRKAKISVEYQWPKIDLALMVIAALTIYMAIRSRRFIPIAAFAACPLIALLIYQIICSISAMRNFRLHNRLVTPAMPSNLQLVFALAGAGVVLFFGTWWGLKFKHIYLDPWPADPKLNSIFMRMTASDAKPFYGGQFIKDNKLKGKMFNYWTEGGFIAWAQEPDPDTGKTPLQLFMDGRAQAAYNRETFDLWSIIISGGQFTAEMVAKAKARRQSLSAADYEKIGRWMADKLKEHDVWVFLMPAAVYNDPEQKNPYHVVKGLEHNSNWPLVFYNNEQKLFVDYTTPQGKELFDGIRTGKTIYPDDFHRSLIFAHNTLLFSVNQLEHQTRQIEIATNTLKAEIDNENLAINAKEKTVAHLGEKLAELTEQLKTVQEQLKVAEKEEGFELEKLEKQKEQIEKEMKAVQAELDTENAIIKAQEKVMAESRDKLAQLSEQLKTVQERLGNAKKQGLDFAIKAFHLNPSAAPMMEIVYLAGRFAELRPQITNFCQNYFNTFVKNQDTYLKQDGYRLKVQAVHLAGNYLETIAREQKDTKFAHFYDEKTKEFASERDKMFKRW